ncbi:MAG: Fic family protein [Deltaproteobacteria bacterium]|nr:Fic family protein [Deltaproteobacteria bacterium]
MFEPKFTITNLLLSNIKKITSIISDLNHRSLPHTVLMKFEKKAASLSTYASTSIEGNPLPLTDVKRLLKTRPAHIRNTEREVLNYNHALEELNKKIDAGQLNINLDLICNIQKQITEKLIENQRWGKLRNEPVFVNEPKSGQLVYLPPDHQDMSRFMNELLEFLHIQKGKIDPLILAGIFHKQFVIIHPFVDGNGRTARLATKTILAEMGVNTFKLFSFENYYNQKVSTYFQKVGLLGNYYELEKAIDFTEWLEYFTDGIIDELLRVKKELELENLSPATTLQRHHQKILDFIKNQGFITDPQYSKLTKRAKATRALDFKKLLEMGLIERFGKGRATHYKLKG